MCPALFNFHCQDGTGERQRQEQLQETARAREAAALRLGAARDRLAAGDGANSRVVAVQRRGCPSPSGQLSLGFELCSLHWKDVQSHGVYLMPS